MNVNHIHEFAYEQDEENCFMMKIIVFRHESTMCSKIEN